MPDLNSLNTLLTNLAPVMKTLGYTGPATFGVILAAGISYLYKNRKPSNLAEKLMRDDLSERIDKLDLKVERLETAIKEVTAEKERETFRADGWYWLTRHARQVAEGLVLDYQLPPLSPWPPDPDLDRRKT